MRKSGFDSRYPHYFAASDAATKCTAQRRMSDRIRSHPEKPRKYRVFVTGDKWVDMWIKDNVR